ncbi:ubiquitin carboxyl-terminal hydrolase 8 [[Candida] anglica]|uniref:Ubiquitin carboxyl-terminal hydrolase n=1 Tax=[Candida] anglica TaxID=148631 RepID=A0ABP0EL25_9ASCO
MSSRKTLPGGGAVPEGKPMVQTTQERTPPPDNFSSIKPCSHITTVLDSQAKDNVFLTYRHAVNISQVMADNRYYTQKKDGTKVANKKLLELKSEALHCTDCSMNNFHNNFICLQCPHVGCFNELNHSYKHFKNNQHFFGIDSHNGLLYCFMCGNYINDPQLEKIRLEAINGGVGSGGSGGNALDEGLDNSAEIDLHYTAPHYKATTGLKGFVNLGSTCFMSCILQTFIHNPIIRNQFFNNDLHYFNCESTSEYHFPNGSIDESNACVTCSIDSIFKNFYASSDTEGFGMTNLLLTAWYKKKSLAGFQEQDAHEFWQFILDEFHQDHERVLKLSGENSNTSSSSTSPDDCKCITHTTFYGQLESSIKCLSCDSVTNTIDPTVDLSLEIRRIKNKNSKEELTLYDCLDLFTKEEKLDAMYKCQYCGERSEATKCLKIKRNPPVLGIQLKRFAHNLTSDKSTKVETPVKIPLFLNISKYTTLSLNKQSEEINGNEVYELFAMVCHMGSVNTGHYVAVVKDGNGQWFRFDDSVISLVSQEDVMNTNAYLLFYIAHKI